MIALPNKHYSEHHKVSETEDDQRTTGKETWKKIRGQQVSNAAGGRWRWQQRTELDGMKWSMVDVPPGATRHKLSKLLDTQPHQFKLCIILD